MKKTLFVIATLCPAFHIMKLLRIFLPFVAWNQREQFFCFFRLQLMRKYILLYDKKN